MTEEELFDAQNPNPHRINDWYPDNITAEYRAYKSRVDNYAVLDFDVRDNSEWKQHSNRTFVIMSAEETLRLANRLYNIAKSINPEVVNELGYNALKPNGINSEVNPKRKITL